jgi:hypothetical protein
MERIEKTYTQRYGLNLIGNLNYIKEKGMDAFLEHEKERWTCPTCGGVICVHTKRCYNCSPL